MSSILSMLSDLPQQFNKHNTSNLLTCIDLEFFDLLTALDDIVLTRDIRYADSDKLDRIGEIIGLSRAAAQSMFGGDDVNMFKDGEQSDYRKALTFYSLWKNSEITYDSWYEIIKATYPEEDLDIKFFEFEGQPNKVCIYIEGQDSKNYNLIPKLAPPGIEIMSTIALNAKISLPTSTIEKKNIEYNYVNDSYIDESFAN